MIRAFITDWGGVLMRTVDIRPRLAWERRLELPPGGLADLFFESPAWGQAVRGEIALVEVWTEVNGQLGLKDEALRALSRDFWTGDRLDQELAEVIRDLQAQGLRTALLSNHSRDLPRLLTDLGMNGLFDVTMVSGVEGVAKPDPVIYRRVLDRLGVAPAEAVFVDDMRRNVETARRLGMLGIRFSGTSHLRRALAGVGLPAQVPSPEPASSIRAVIFDWGGVLSPLTFFERTRDWEERLGLADGTMNRVLWGTKWKELEVGAISQEMFDDHVASGLRLPDREAVRTFYGEYYDDNHLDQDVVAAVRALRKRYRVALLTNAFPGHAEVVEQRHGFNVRTEFDLYVNSAEVKLAKPDPAIYQLALDQLGVAPGEAIFLDDQVRNTDAAQALGMHTVVFADAESALADLAALLGHPLSVVSP